MADEVKEEVKTEEVKTEVKPQEAKSEKKAPAKKGGKRPNNKRGIKGGKAAPAAKKPAVFSDSLEDRYPNLAAKLKKKLEDDLKQKIKDAQNDPNVKKASEKFGSK
ncbi:MAG: hypothetical protein HUK19_04005 [Fibrobacter sp.]|nr:hypothetical protein [Fibrobacter sp.]